MFNTKDLIDKDNSLWPTPNVKFDGRKCYTVCIWWDHHDIIPLKFLNHNQTLNADIYSQQLHCVHENLRKHYTFINSRDIVLLHDNTKPHSTRITGKKY